MVSMGKRGSSRHGEARTHGSAARAELSAARPAGGAAKAERQLAPPIPYRVLRRALLARRRSVPISEKAAKGKGDSSDRGNQPKANVASFVRHRRMR